MTTFSPVSSPIAKFAGLHFDQGPAIMGIVNVTPDSFSDGGHYFAQDRAISHGLDLVAQGAVILDIGGESTRPGAPAVGEEEELRRVLPVIEGLREAGYRGLISIDTRHSLVMDEAVRAGADIINDVTTLTGDPDSLSVAADLQAPVIIMHMQGEPQTMQANPTYTNVVEDILHYLKDRISACEAAGIAKANICVDPGIGFGKTLEHNLTLLANLHRFHDLGCAVLLGASRKSFIAKLVGEDVVASERLGGSLAAAIAATTAQIQIVRTHDVFDTAQACKVAHAIACAK